MPDNQSCGLRVIILSLPLLIWYPVTRMTHSETRRTLAAGEPRALSET